MLIVSILPDDSRRALQIQTGEFAYAQILPVHVGLLSPCPGGGYSPEVRKIAILCMHYGVQAIAETEPGDLGT